MSRICTRGGKPASQRADYRRLPVEGAGAGRERIAKIDGLIKGLFAGLLIGLLIGTLF